MNCTEAGELLHAYVDGELDVVRAQDVEKHLASCSACSRSYENLRSLKSALKSSSYFRAPASLRREIRTSVFGKEPKPVSAPFSLAKLLRLAIPLAAAVVVLLLLMPFLTDRSRNKRLAQEITANHVRSLMVDHRTDIASSDQHTVKPWFEGKLDFAPPVVDLAPQEFPLVGGRLDYLEGRPVAALVYQRHKHTINLFIWPASSMSTQSEKLMVQKGYNLVRWRASGLNYWAISDLNAKELKEFVQLLIKNGAGS